MGLESMLDAVMIRLVGQDKYMAARMYVTGLSTQSAPGHVWTDYMFLAACYSFAGGDHRFVQRCLASISEGFPNYDPAKRFSWDSTGVNDIGGIDFKDQTAELRRFQFKAPVIGHMNKFCASHLGFSFGDAFGEYFPSARGMRIKVEKIPTQNHPPVNG